MTIAVLNRKAAMDLSDPHHARSATASPVGVRERAPVSALLSRGAPRRLSMLDGVVFVVF
jgi:hypothetical protein